MSYRAIVGLVYYQCYWRSGLKHVQQNCYQVGGRDDQNKICEIKFLITSFRAIAYYFITTISAVVLGICLVTTIRPGQGAKIVETRMESVDKASKVLTPDTLMDLVR